MRTEEGEQIMNGLKFDNLKRGVRRKVVSADRSRTGL